MGYGPLVRATIGVTGLWTSEQAATQDARHPFFDATTIFPDHVVGRISAIGALAGLIRRMRTGAGARIHVSQAEAAINQLDTVYVTQAAEVSGVGTVVEDDASHRVLACAGDDEWCVVSLRSAADRDAVAAVIRHESGELDAALAAWAAARSPAEVSDTMQAAGVAAGPMNRALDVHDHPQLVLRKVFSDMAHPLFEDPLVTEAGPAPYRNIPPAPQNPAPLPGADTARVCRDVLGLAPEEIERLIGDGVLFTAQEKTGVVA